MKKIILIFGSIIVGLFLIIAVAGFIRFNFTNGGDILPEEKIFDARNATYLIGNETFTLKNGKVEKEYAPGSATKNALTIFGEPVSGDLNGDGKNDEAILLVNEPGGSGTFYYAVLIINNKPTSGMLLGDRIAPQTVEIREGRAVYNYAERKAGDPMTTPPSIGKSVWVHYDKNTGEIGEWVKDFEGESAI